MAEHDWPSGLPCFLIAGYARGGGDDGVLRSEMDGGLKARPRATSPPYEPLTARLSCTHAQLQTLLDFWRVTLKRVLPFNHADPSKAGAAAEYRFAGRPSYEPSPNGARWRVTLPLEVVSTTPGDFGLGLLTEDDEELTT